MGAVCTRRALVMLFIFNIVLLAQNWNANQHYTKIESLLEGIQPNTLEIKPQQCPVHEEPKGKPDK